MDEQKNVILNGCRTRSWKDRKTGEDVVRFIADLYMPGMGAYDAMLTSEQYAQLATLAPGTALVQTYRMEIRDEVISRDGGRPFAVRRPTVVFGALSLVENARKAS